MRILILGGSGMIGHQLFTNIQKKHTVKVTLRKELSHYNHYKLFSAANSYPKLDSKNIPGFEAAINDFMPDVIINALGDINQSRAEKSPLNSIEVNAAFPHIMANMSLKYNVRFIQISTDCVFLGTKGNYVESDKPDAVMVYGRSKALGEVMYPKSLTLRTSTIGLELGEPHNLIGWFLSQKGKIKGYKNAIYTGVITAELARVIEFIITKHPEMTGIWQVASEPISKFEILTKLKEKLGLHSIEIEPDAKFHCDRSLNPTKFLEYTGYTMPSWESMLDELALTIKQRKKNDF